MSTASKSDKGTLPLLKPYSEELQLSFTRFKELSRQYNAIKACQYSMFYPQLSADRLLEGVSAYRGSLESVRPEDRLDSILIDELRERTEIMDLTIRGPTEQKFDYKKTIRCFGILPTDVAHAATIFNAKDTSATAERWLSINGGSFSTRPEGEEDTRKVRAAYKTLLRASFDAASAGLRANFTDADSYMSSVDFVDNKDGTSSEITGRILLNSYSTEIVQVRRGMRWENVLNPFNAAAVIGEEGILGHQGQSLLNEGLDLPYFLKSSDNPMTYTSTEVLGAIGKLRMTRILDNNPALIKDVSNEDFEFFRARQELHNQTGALSRFSLGYLDYLFFENNRDAEAAVRSAYSIIRHPIMLTEAYVREQEGVYNSGKFWQNFTSRTKTWAYIAADFMADKIEKTLSGLSESSAKKIMDNLPIGRWTKSGFESYFDYLLERFA